MANANTPAGFQPVKNQGSSVFTGGLETFYVPASDSTALYNGDPVTKAGSADAGGIASVARTAAAGTITGVVVGFLDSASMALGYRAASTAAYVLVCTNPHMEYEIQEDGVGGQLAAADIGLNADFIVAAGNAYSKRSGVMLDTSTKATTAGLPVKIIGLSQRPDNAFGAYAKVRVKINLSTEIAGVAGI